MKIAFVINSFKSRNGASVFLSNLIEESSKIKNISVIAVSLYDLVDDSLLKQINAAKVKLFCCHKKRKFDIKSSIVFRRIIKAFQPDIINTHLSVMTTYFLAFGFKRRNWKIVKTYHSIPGKDLNNINLLLEKQYAKKQMLSFIGISKTITQISLELFPNSKIQTIENGIPLPKEPSITRKPVIYDFVIVASLEPVKNHMLLFHAFQRYVCFYKDAILAVVGSGSRENVYRKYVADNNLSNNVIFFGEIDDVSIALSKSRVFILSSTQEGNPISILEALSLGLPIIAPRVGGIPDIVKEDANGLLFESKNENELLNCMLKLSSSHQLYDTISATNIRYSKRFSIKKTMNSYVRFFDNLIK